MFFIFIRIKKIRVKKENQTLLFKVKHDKKHRKSKKKIKNMIKILKI